MMFLYRMSEGVVSFMGFQNMGSTSITLDFLNFCFKENPSNLSSISVNLSQDAREQDEPQSNLTLNILYPKAQDIKQIYGVNSGDCPKVVYELSKVCRQYTRNNPVISSMNIQEFIEEMFPHIQYNYSSNIQHQECVALEKEVLPQIEGHIVTFKEIEKMMMNWNTSEIQQAFILARRLSSYYGEIINIGLIYHKYEAKLNEACNWLRPVLSYKWSRLVLSKPTISEATNLQHISTSLTKIKNIYLKLHSYYNALIHPDIEILQSYFIGNITKIELGEILKSMEKSWDVLY